MFAALAVGTLALSAAILALPQPAGAQSTTEYVAQGNAAYDARKVPEALADYEKALAIDPKNYEALWRASRAQVDLGEFNPNEQERNALYKTATDRARLAAQVNPGAADGHFSVARAVGRMAQTLGARDRVKYAGVVRDEALACLKIEPQHAGCLHVMGVWNAEVMRLSGFTRMIARNFLGGKVFSEASWASARKYLEDAVNADPRRIVHRLDLAHVYADMELIPQAKTEYERVVSGEIVDYNDPHYKEQAAAALKKL
ncbi:MAG TPA: tetratricopeptide repeat protein [Candidatus Elarobacter sp.]|nr:tetratricopeptide repeat protein [Candidatus Elarobacter sp.]